MAPRLLACLGKPSWSERSKATTDVAAEEQRQGGAVVVELFKSQGCTTSPEAEVLASRLGRGDFELGIPLILLAHHVDYWDDMGWKDHFGSSLSTVRRKAYVEALGLDTMFTPQVVVQGRTHCTGTDQETLLASIASAPRFPAPMFQVKIQLYLQRWLFNSSKLTFE